MHLPSFPSYIVKSRILLASTSCPHPYVQCLYLFAFAFIICSCSLLFNFITSFPNKNPLSWASILDSMVNIFSAPGQNSFHNKISSKCNVTNFDTVHSKTWCSSNLPTNNMLYIRFVHEKFYRWQKKRK